MSTPPKFEGFPASAGGLSDGRLIDEVWKLYQRTHELTGGVSALLEWDANIPSFDEIHAKVIKARQFSSR